MPMHDWTRVKAGIFHSFHNAWLTELNNVLNEGLLPPDFYALMEQHAGKTIPDVLTLSTPRQPPSPTKGGLLLADVPPKVRLKKSLASLRRTLAIRHVYGHQIVAILEIVSPANKDRGETVEHFVTKIENVLSKGVHALVVDVLQPGLHDPNGMHGAIQQALSPYDLPYELPNDEPLTLASYVAGTPVDAFIEHLAVGVALPEMPLFLDLERYVNVPLETTYQAAYRGFPAFWRNVLEGKTVAPE